MAVARGLFLVGRAPREARLQTTGRAICVGPKRIVYLLILANTAALARSPLSEKTVIALARIQCLWVELQAARKDPVRYEAIAERIRREADSFRKTPVRPRLMH